MTMIEPAALPDRHPLITNIQRYSVQDGPGIRTTIFLKGCPLRCPWCHNPETQACEREINYDSEKCTGCGACVQVCPSGASRTDGTTSVLDRGLCTRCGACVDACPAGAREWSGQVMTIEEVVREAKEDEMFFLSSDGGVTIGGGDPLYFPHFTMELARRLQDEMLHVAVDTAAFCRWSYLDELRPYVNLFLIDLKTMDGDKYRDVIRGSLTVVQQNLERLAAAGAAIRVRIPVVPGFNDSEADCDAFATYLGTLKDWIAGVDVLPFHAYAGKKYGLLGRWDTYQYRDMESLQPEEVIGLARRLKQAGFSTADNSLTVGGLTG